MLLFHLKNRITEALKEDIKDHDITSEAIFTKFHITNAYITVKEKGTIAGLTIAKQLCVLVDNKLKFIPLAKDGEKVKKGQCIAKLYGKTISILKAERTLLNFLQRLSGIASLTAEFVKKTAMTKTIILDTRKTSPLWRDLEKYAVKMGGGQNHRMGLYDAFLIKDNHIAAAGSITKAVQMVRKSRFFKKCEFIEVEIKNTQELKEAYYSKVDRIMFDNMKPTQIKKGVKWLNNQKKPIPQTEASGGITLKNVHSIAETGVDYISLGSITHSAPALDISLLIK